MNRLFAVAIAFLSGRALADGLPIVKTRVNITSSAFTGGLGADKTEAERSIAAAVADLAQDRYPFLSWSENANGASAAATLVVGLEEKSITPTASAYYLTYQGVIGTAKPFALRFGRLSPLYAREKLRKPFNSRRILQQDIVRRMTSDLLTHAADFEDSFVARIALSRSKPRVDADRNMIVVDFPWDRMQAAPDSILRVVVSVKKLDSDASTATFNPDGEVQLTHLRRSGSAMVGGHLGHVRCGTVDTTQWLGPAIADALDERRIRNAAVYMHRYRYGAGSGRAQSPD